MNPEKHEIVALIKPQFEAGKIRYQKAALLKIKKIHVNVINIL